LLDGVEWSERASKLPRWKNIRKSTFWPWLTDSQL
jgi:hypothetical protein